MPEIAEEGAARPVPHQAFCTRLAWLEAAGETTDTTAESLAATEAPPPIEDDWPAPIANTSASACRTSGGSRHDGITVLLNLSRSQVVKDVSNPYTADVEAPHCKRTISPTSTVAVHTGC